MKEQKIIYLLIALLIAVVLEAGLTIYHLGNYDAQKAAGNEKWQLVDKELREMHDKIDTFINEHQ